MRSMNLAQPPPCPSRFVRPRRTVDIGSLDLGHETLDLGHETLDLSHEMLDLSLRPAAAEPLFINDLRQLSTWTFVTESN
jgi:hypothetical protein